MSFESAAPPPKGPAQSQQLPYTKCYCEENIYHWCRLMRTQHPDQGPYYAVFISNPARAVPIWGQRSAMDAASPGLWDYHVIGVQGGPPGACRVQDADCTLASPVDARLYCAHAFPPLDTVAWPRGVDPDLGMRRFRLIPADQYLAHFSSDRSHMLLPGSASEYAAPPPAYPCLYQPAEGMNLPRYWDVTTSSLGPEKDARFGVVLEEPAFLAWLEGLYGGSPAG